MKGTILRWSLILAVIVALVMVSAPLAASPAVAKTIRIPIENSFICCSMDAGTMWFSDDGILHIRDRVLQAVVTSTEDYHAGAGQNWANANIDPATGIGTYFGYMEIYPDAYPDGYWAGHWVMQITATGAGGIARLQGYGELDGLATKSEITPLPPPVLTSFADLCDGNQPVSGVYAVGFVMDPGGK
jgi:hypothetical protein